MTLATLHVAATTPPGDDLQAVLNRDADLLLQPGKDYQIATTLRYTRPGQKIATEGAREPAQFARLSFAPGAHMTMIDGAGQSGVVLERVIIDGNRSALQPVDGKVPGQPFTVWGGPGGDRQIIRQCLIFNARCGGGWAAIHINEGAQEVAVTDNLILGAGVDPHGNGRSEHEQPFGWGDGISTAARHTLVRNNLILDATDDGIMVQGAPGSLVEDNVIIAYSRQMLGGIALIDPYAAYTLTAESKRFDYRGVRVRRNHIEAWGGRIHIGIPLGGPGWHQRFAGTTLEGATVEANTLAGEAFGYGVVANGIDGFTVTANVSTARHSGRGDGPQRRVAPAPAAAFLYEIDHVGQSILQSEFSPATAPLVSLLAAWPPPADRRGYRLAAYTPEEASGILHAAYHEILARAPSADELSTETSRLVQSPVTADALRHELIGRSTNAASLSTWRRDRWPTWALAAWQEAHRAEPARPWPSASAIFLGLRHHSPATAP